MSQFYSDYYAQNPIQEVAEAVKGSSIDANTWNADMMDAQTLSNSLQMVQSPITSDMNYLAQHYDEYKLTLKELEKYSALDYRKIIDGILKKENISLNDKDLVLVDKEYLDELENVLYGLSNKRYVQWWPFAAIGLRL